MNNLKAILAALLYLGSVVSLVVSAVITPQVLAAYGLDYPATLGPRVPAFTEGSFGVLLNSAWLCGGLAAISVLVLLVALRKASTRDAKLYWTAILAAVNYHVVAGVYTTMIIGYFLLPKLRSLA